MTWNEDIVALRDLCTDLNLFDPDQFDSGHPVFDAIVRSRADRSRSDRIFVENVIGFFQEQVQLNLLFQETALP